MKAKWLLPLLAFMLVLSLAGCMKSAETFGTSPVSREKTIDLINAQGQKMGTAHLVQLTHGVKMDVKASGLAPGAHGIHFHETGVCEAPDFKSAGGHFNPAGTQHGFDNPKGYHAGDMPNLIVGADGRAQGEFFLSAVTLETGRPNSLLKQGGTALVIHEKADDFVSDPAGNAGGRIACGVIR